MRVEGQRVDQEQVQFRRAAMRVGVQVAVMSAAMVAVGAGLFVAYLWWRATAGPAHEPGEHPLVVSLNPTDLAVAGVVLGLAAVTIAGGAALLSARTATQPLAEAMRRQRTFVRDASHELRTPLAVLSARTQQLAIINQDAECAPIIDELGSDVGAMTDVVNDLLALITAEGVESGSAPLIPTILDVIADLRLLADAASIDISGPNEGDSELQVAMPPVQLRRALTAVVDNAIGHSPAGGTVDVSVTTTPTEAKVSVRDQGSGITGIKPSQVFARDVRGDSPHPRPSHGIGLALARELVTQHGGDLAVEGTGPDGTAFQFTIPLSEHS